MCEVSLCTSDTKPTEKSHAGAPTFLQSGPHAEPQTPGWGIIVIVSVIISVVQVTRRKTGGQVNSGTQRAGVNPRPNMTFEESPNCSLL